jgi:sigma-B regulation protein RsbQ
MSHDVIYRNNVQVRGNGPRTLVLAHGFGCDQQAWRHMVPGLQADHRVVLFDYVGSGRSDLAAYDPRRYADLHGYASDLLEVCAALDLHDVVLVGHSVSSMIGLLAALEQPALFERLAMIGPSPRYLDDPPGYVGGFQSADVTELLELMERNDHAWANFLAPVAMRNADRPELAEELGAMFCAGNPWTTRGFARAVFQCDHRADLARLDHPVLLLQCRDDIVAPEVVGDYMHRHLPRSTLVHLQSGGHCPHMSHPEDTAAALRAWLAGPA